jgi:hypothetical protein
MPTPKEQYANELIEVSRRYDSLEDGTIKRLIALLQDVRKDMALTLADNATTDFEIFRTQNLISSVDNIIVNFQSGLSKNFNTSFVGAGKLGVEIVANPLDTIGLNVSSFNALAPSQVNVALDFSAELVQNITEDLRSKINTQLRQATLAQQSPFEAMRGITKALGVNPDDGIWGTRNRPDAVKGVAARAEAIARTEMTRINNLAQSSTQQQAGNLIPGLLKRWIATARGNTRDTHISAHRRYFNDPIPINEPFRVGRSELMYPGDPRGEAKETINCRCTMATIVPEIGVQETPLDKAIKKENKKRKQSSD